MLHVVRGQGAVPDTAMRGMFAARKSVFVDLLRWEVPVVEGRYEIDQFDNEHACYLILSNADGAHLGSTRLLPTQRPHILDTFYASLCEHDPPRGAAIFEITRFCLDRQLRAIERRMVRDTLVAALADHALESGIERYSAIAEVRWLQQILAFGWRCLPLGLPQLIDGRMLGALEIAVTSDTPALLAAGGVRAQRAILDRPHVPAAKEIST